MQTPYEAGRGYELTQIRMDQFHHLQTNQREDTLIRRGISLWFTWLPARLRVAPQPDKDDDQNS